MLKKLPEDILNEIGYLDRIYIIYPKKLVSDTRYQKPKSSLNKKQKMASMKKTVTLKNHLHV